MKNFLAAAAAISVAVAPTAATAGTRAGDVVPATYSVDRASATAESASEPSTRSKIRSLDASYVSRRTDALSRQ